MRSPDRLDSPRRTRFAAVHAGGIRGYAAPMTNTPVEPVADPDDDAQPEPLEPSVTNPDADGIDEVPS